MNKVILMGRLTRDVEVSYTNGTEPTAIAKFSLAVNKKFKRDGEPDADFINCIAFGKTGEFAEKYFTKGQMISVIGRLQVRNWEDKDGNKRVSTDVIVEEQFFAEGKKGSEGGTPNHDSKPNKQVGSQSMSAPEEDEDLPY